MNAEAALTALRTHATPQRAIASAWFFKTGPGQYGEGDVFLGVKVPDIRLVAKQFFTLPLGEVEELLHNKFHEARLLALIILVRQYTRGSEAERDKIVALYLKNMKYVNNWDLVDSSAGYILGPYVEGTDMSLLKRLAVSESLWERRIAIISCFYSIKRGDAGPAFVVIELLKNDSEDLIHKAVGWMLREIGERCSKDELTMWLKRDGQYTRLPRTMLRYAIEHFGESERKGYLAGRV